MPTARSRCKALFGRHKKEMVAECLESFRLGSAMPGSVLNKITVETQDLLQNNLISFFNDGLNVMKNLKQKKRAQMC